MGEDTCIHRLPVRMLWVSNFCYGLDTDIRMNIIPDTDSGNNNNHNIMIIHCASHSLKVHNIGQFYMLHPVEGTAIAIEIEGNLVILVPLLNYKSFALKKSFKKKCFYSIYLLGTFLAL